MTAGHKKLILQAALALAGSVAMIFFGYYLNAYIARDRLDIEFVELVPEYETYDIPYEVYQKLDNWYFKRRAHRLGLGGSYVLDNPHFHPRDISGVRRILTEFKENASTDVTRISALIEKAAADSSEEILDEVKEFLTIHTGSSQSFQTANSVADVPPALDKLKLERALIKSAIVASKSIIEDMDAFVPKRTGNLLIIVTVINRGPTDGLLRKSGAIILPTPPGSRIPIYGPVTKIERRSIKTVHYKVNWGRGDPKNMDRLKSLVENKSGSSIKIELRDIRQMKVTSSDTPLPVSDSWAMGRVDAGG